MKTVERIEYLSQLSMWRDKQIVKVITGIRRSGKSTLMEGANFKTWIYWSASYGFFLTISAI